MKKFDIDNLGCIMVKLPIGANIVIDLWDPVKKHGIAKHYGDTMDLVQVESEFELNKGDPAIVVKSNEGFVLAIPKNNLYARIIHEKGSGLDIQGLIHIIYEILKENDSRTGGILSQEEIFKILQDTPIKHLIHEDSIKKVMKAKSLPFDLIKYGKQSFFALHPSDVVNDKSILLNLAVKLGDLTIDKIQTELGWSELRIIRILSFFVANNRCRKDSSYKNGEHYYFQQIS